MEYKVYNYNCIKEKKERIACEKLIKKQVVRLEKFSADDSKSLIVNIHFNLVGKEHYQITGIVKLKQGPVIVKQSGDNLEAIIYSLFDRLKLVLSKKLHKYRNENLRHKRNIRNLSFKENLTELIQLKNEGSDTLLRDLLKLLLNDLAKYIRRRLKTAELTSAINRGKFKLQELLDEIYLEVYDRLDEVPKDDIESTVWLYRVTDEYLEDKFRELEFEKVNFDRIEDILENEFKIPEEEYTINADFEIIPLDELDEHKTQSTIYSVNDLSYSEDEASLLDNLILNLSEEDIHEIIEKELVKLPVFQRTIMDLHLIGQMSIQEIAKIKGVSENTIEIAVRDVKNQLKRKLSFLL